MALERGEGVSVTPWPLFTPGKDPVPIVQEAGWAPGPVSTGAGNLASQRDSTPDRPARSQSLYLLRYLAHYTYIYMCVCIYIYIYFKNLVDMKLNVKNPDLN